MERQKQITADGSHTLYEPVLNVTYHSVHGAVQESRHIYVEAGLRWWMDIQPVALNILEVGFGTGLNALLTLEAVQERQLTVHYHAIEPFPLNDREFSGLNYCAVLQRPNLALPFRQMHVAAGNEPLAVSPWFIVYRHLTTVQEFRTPQLFNLVYYDAFAPDVQPELWAWELFKKIFDAMVINGVLVTYCSKGTVRRALIEAGFSVEKIPGPAHKREMIRAVRK
ncbi:tRNA (5-methylaminomethyl-2-thiouridine)(34)-methyltransferase MnmD [Agriterribacter sp.]|uniref:tRNA (5-methylaminomethyl-2-thiouridine)(34)-methyltransferase MnmD n=1 Tax=Agriterribacter sp. TaxID=2821509 RepID=UPI002BE768F1|nr:tRNA (5-methylaminomethyl-2-thiouridine)(34)-methyltransferase MnmD [Agriterribacter sp.]HRN58052.1 tRNA (5-methylaminomethyl-2-thiouridine)(34)-methyltransferase MnmD [Agriterribacter sp.]HRO44492.1 tRNA (5-methylaminomethyl-2-thiouridine)(34)-methyltransferase MnmD [Agriterribacter sp.]HRQ16482.1 tRNA (5-methylaminomethyl-2-thiouridine)(34)-methyltransferase MnmD [Agriterribacter sp.]